MHTSYMQVCKKALSCCCDRLCHVTPSNNRWCQPIILQYCFLVQAAALLNQRGKKIKITPSIFTIIVFCWCRLHPHRYMMHQQEEPKVPSQEMMRSRAGLSNSPSVSCHNCHLQSLTKRCPRIYRTVSRALFCASPSPSSKPFTAATLA